MASDPPPPIAAMLLAGAPGSPQSRGLWSLLAASEAAVLHYGLGIGPGRPSPAAWPVVAAVTGNHLFK